MVHPRYMRSVEAWHHWFSHRLGPLLRFWSSSWQHLCWNISPQRIARVLEGVLTCASGKLTEVSVLTKKQHGYFLVRVFGVCSVTSAAELDKHMSAMYKRISPQTRAKTFRNYPETSLLQPVWFYAVLSPCVGTFSKRIICKRFQEFIFLSILRVKLWRSKTPLRHCSQIPVFCA